MPDEIVWLGLAAAPTILGVVQVVKQATGLPSRFAGLLALVLGVAGGVTFGLYADPSVGALLGGAQGIQAGLAAAGLYSGADQVRRHGDHEEAPK